MHFVDASYTPSPLAIYRGNPLIEALPDYTSFSTRAIIEKLKGEIPPIHEMATRRQRDQWLGNLASKMFMPLTRHIQLQELIDLAIRQGYEQNSPTTAADVRRMNEAYERQQKGEKVASLYPSEQSGAPLSISVIGCSGIGKTYSITRILRLYPQVIRHPDWINGANFMQIVYLRVECPSNGSVKALCSSIISEIDHITGEQFHELYVKQGRSTAEILKSRVAHLLAVYHVGLLVIDEIQNLVLNRTDREILFNFIVSLSNSLCVPLLFVGTPKVQRFMQTDLRISRRFGTLGSVVWKRLEREKAEWRSFITALWQTNILESSQPDIPEAVEAALFDCSQGITDILVKLFLLTQKYILVTATKRSQTEVMSAEDVYGVFNTYFTNVHPMIDALRKNDVAAIEKYQDLTFSADCFEKASVELSRELMDATEVEPPEAEGVNAVRNTLTRMLPTLGVDLNQSTLAIIDSELEKMPTESLAALMNAVLTRINEAERQQTS